jgi:hypothetical protein
MKTKTVERLMNETPEHIKQQVSEYADNLVNKKQSSIDWLFEQVWINPVSKLPEILEQAKAMHKEEIVDAYNESFRLRDKPYSTAVKYYNETFGGNNE